MSGDILEDMNNSSIYEDLEEQILNANIEMLESEIMLLALEKSAESKMLKPSTKLTLKYLISVGMDELPTLSNPDGSETNLLGLSQEMIDGVTKLSESDLQLIKDVYVKELTQLTNGISSYLLENEIDLTYELDISKLPNLNKLILDINTELENIVEMHNTLRELKYKVIPEKVVKKVDAIEHELATTLNDMSELHEKTLHEVYPSEEYYIKIKQAKQSFEEELTDLNEKLEKLQTSEEIHDSKDKRELEEIKSQYEEIIREIRVKQMAIKEVQSCNANS